MTLTPAAFRSMIPRKPANRRRAKLGTAKIACQGINYRNIDNVLADVKFCRRCGGELVVGAYVVANDAPTHPQARDLFCFDCRPHGVTVDFVAIP